MKLQFKRVPHTVHNQSSSKVMIDTSSNQDIQGMANGERGPLSSDFHKYQILLFILTTIPYISVVGSLLSSNFFDEAKSGKDDDKFVSLLGEWNIDKGSFKIWIFTLRDFLSASIMFGAMCGAFASGVLSDRLGRKTATLACLIVVGLCNFCLCLFGAYSWLLSGIIFLILGAASGGYMVVNIVLMVEAVEHSRSRLLIISLNGFSPGISAMALVAYFTRYWLTYHLSLAIIAIASTLFIFFFANESESWLRQNQAKNDVKLQPILPADQSLHNLMDDEAKATLESTNSASVVKTNTYGQKKVTFGDLFKNRAIVVSLLTLFYCFLISSFVSFAGYFNSAILPGNRFTNLFILGLLKTILALIPFVCGGFLRRRTILLLSVAVALSANIVLIIFLAFPSLGQGIIISYLSILMTSALDPNWKVLHLYTTELFPTLVRNSARGFCQGGARLGSVLAPLLRSIYSVYPLFSMILCAILLFLEFVVAFIVFPRKDRAKLPENLEPEENVREESGIRFHSKA